MSTEENLNAGRPVQVGAHSPESLRVALEKTCDRFEAMAARNGDVRLGADAVLKAIHELLAAHPVEPAGVRLAREGLEEMHARMAAESVGVSDEAVDALARVLFDAEWVPGDWSWEQYPTPNRWHDLARKGLAALPHLQPQPVASREALRERIAEALHDIDNVHTWQQEDRCPDSCGVAYYSRATAVLNLLNGTGVDSTVNTCPGCGVNVIGHERCGDATRPGCAS